INLLFYRVIFISIVYLRRSYRFFISMSDFTYVELLLSLMVVIFITMSLPQMMTFFQKIDLAEDIYDFDIFLIDIYDVYKNSESIEVEGANRLTFKRNQTEVTYHYTNGRLIKSINQEGFVTMMYHVDSVTITSDKQVVSLKIKGLVDETLLFKK